MASKAGEIARIGIGDRQVGELGDRQILHSCVRDLVHVHKTPGPLIVAGTDDGHVAVYEMGSRATTLGGIVALIDLQRPDFVPMPPAPQRSVEELDKSLGVTALYVMGHPAANEVQVLVGTRQPSLRLLTLRRDRSGRWAARADCEAQAPGWVSWLLRGPDGARADPVLVTESGDLAWVTVRTPWFWRARLKLERLPRTRVLPTAALRLHDQLLLIGCSVGLLAIFQDGLHHLVPVTRAEVLSIQRWGTSVALGLADGRVKIVEASYLESLARGERRPPPRRQEVQLDRGAVLELFASPAGRPRVMFAATRDNHVVHLRPKDLGEVRQTIRYSLGYEPVATRDRLGSAASTEFLAILRARADEVAAAGGATDLAHWRHVEIACLGYLESDDQSRWLDDVARNAHGLPQSALRDLSASIVDQPGDRDAQRLVRTSASLLQALLRLEPDVRDRAIRDHLRDVKQAVAHSGRMSTAGAGRVSLWIRFVRKYVLDGSSFVSKRVRRRALAMENQRIGKPTDALIFETLLYQERYDLSREDVLNQRIVALCNVTGTQHFVAATADGVLWFGAGPGTPLQQITGAARTVPLALAATATESGFRVVRVGSDHLEVGMVGLAELAWTDEVRRAIDACAVVSVPHEPEQFVLGMQSETRAIALLRRSGLTWQVQRIQPRPGVRGSARTPLRAPGRTFCKVSVTAHGGSLYGLVGTETGMVDVVDLDGLTYVNDAPLQLRYPVSTVTITAVPDGPKTELTCFVGTTRGFMYAFQVRSESPQRWHHVWRETITEPVVAIRVWRCPLYVDPPDRPNIVPRQILALVGESGMVSLHEVGHYESDWPATESGNVTFLGCRLDRVRLPGSVTDFLVHEDTRSFAASTPDRRLMQGVFCATRDSTDRIAQPDGTPFADLGLWQRLDVLYDTIGLEQWLATGDPAWAISSLATSDDPARARLLLLIHQTTGGLGRYVLRRLLWGPAHEAAPDRVPIDAFPEVIRSLDPTHAPDRQLLKVAWKALGRRGIGLGTGRMEADPRADAALRTAVGILHRSFVGLVEQPGALSNRLRICIIKEVMRANLWAHVARAGAQSDVRRMVRDILGSCLTADDRVVRLEALRSISACLRNLGSWTRQDPGCLQHAFPNGTADVAWVATQVEENLRARGDVSFEDVLSDGWGYTSVIIGLLKLFPQETVAICERFTRAAGHSSYLRVVAARMREMTDVEMLHRAVCRYLASDEVTLLPLERLPFIAAYARGRSRLRGSAVERRADARLAALAVLWGSDSKTRATEEALAAPLRELERGEAPIDETLRTLLDLFRLVTRDDPGHQVGEHIDQTRERIEALPGLLTHERHAIAGILERWENKYVRSLPVRGDKIEHMPGWTYGRRVGWGTRGIVYKAVNSESPEEAVIKVSAHIKQAEYREQFCVAAARNLKLSACPHIATVIEGTISHPADHAYAAYAMRFYNGGDLRAHYDAARKHGPRSASRVGELVCRVARDIVPALAYAHRERVVHQDIHAGNVLAHRVHDGRPMGFVLADFDLAFDVSSLHARRLAIGKAEQGAPGQTPQRYDVIQLAGMLGRMICGSPLDQAVDPVQLEAEGPRVRSLWQPAIDALHREVRRVLVANEAIDDANELLHALGPVFVVRVFLCYSHGDQALVRQFCEAARARCGESASLFMDVDLTPGTKWELEVLPELRAANLVVPFLSGNMRSGSYAVDRELPEALAIDAEDYEIAPITLSAPEHLPRDLRERLEDHHQLGGGRPLTPSDLAPVVDEFHRFIQGLRRRLQSLDPHP